MNIKICTFNVCLGLRCKINLIKDFLNENKIDILCLQETEIDAEENLSIYEIPGYVTEYEKTLENQKIRTLMYVKANLNHRRRHDLEKAESHIILITVNENNFGLASIYRTYKLTHKATYEEALDEQISVLKTFVETQENAIVMGDINFDYNKRTEQSYHHRRLYDRWLGLEEECQLVQLVDFTTWSRTCRGQLKQSILDQVFTNNHSLIESVDEGNAVISDHTPVVATLSICMKKEEEVKIWARDWKNYSPTLLQERLALVDWNIDFKEVQDYNDEMEHRIMSVLDKIIPFGWRNFGPKKVQESLTIRKLKRTKKNLMTNAKRRGSAELYERGRALERKIRGLIASSTTNKIRNQVLTGGNHGLWKGIRMAQDKPIERIPTEMTSGGVAITTRIEQAQVFATVFQDKIKNIVAECEVKEDVYNGQIRTEAGNENVFSQDLVEDIMTNLKAKNSYGYDNIPMRVLRDGAVHLAKPYHKLMNMIYVTKTIPNQWKVARILPLHKKGAKNNFNNYRPISNLCVATKIFERCILKRIGTLAEEGNLFTERQHGFRKGRSTISAARVLQREISKAMDDNNYVAVASLDLSSAFDVVNTELLLKRITKMGLPQDVVGLLREWLVGRIAYVEVEGSCSEFFEVESGTVQGSVLGPVLFNLFISPFLEKSSGPAYADDSYHIAISESKQEAVKTLQDRIIESESWLASSGLKVNLEKTELTIFHRHDTSSANIKVKDIVVNSSSTLKVLGIVFDNRLQWDKQVEKVTRETRRSLQGLNIIKRHFTEQELLTLVTSLCFSKLYYGSQVWLLPTLKESLYKKLFSQSGQCLSICNRELSHINLHKKYLRATPKLFSLYQTAVNYYETMTENDHALETPDIRLNTLSDRRNVMLTFVRTNKYKVGLNLLSNRLRAISKCIPKSFISQTKNQFKTFCKINLIQKGLSLL